MLYWKPEHPPGLTPMRSARSSSPSCSIRALTFSAALSVMLSMVSCFWSISPPGDAVFSRVDELLHRSSYTSTAHRPAKRRSQRPQQARLGETRLPRGDAPPGPREERGGVGGAQSPAPAGQARVGPHGPPVGARDVARPSIGARGVEVVGVGPGEPLHRLLLDACRPGEEQDPLGRREGRRVGYGATSGRQHVAQAAREVPVEVLRAPAGEERPLGERDGGQEENRHEREEGPRYDPLLPAGTGRVGLPRGLLLALPLLRRSRALFPLVQDGVGAEVLLGGGGERGPRCVRLHRGGHREAGGGVEGVPAYAGEVGLDPRVHVAPGHHVLIRPGLPAHGGAVDHPRGDARLAQQEGYRGRELGAEALLTVAEELLYRLVRAAVADVEVVGEATVVDQVALDHPRCVVGRRGVVLALYLLRRLGDYGRTRRELEEGLRDLRRVGGARAPQLLGRGLGDLRDHGVGAVLGQRLGQRPGPVGVLVGQRVRGRDDLVPPEEDVGAGVQYLEALPHGAGLDARRYLLAVVERGLGGVDPAGAVEVVQGAPAPEQ